jgi:Flp pilus assembly protein TadD
MNLAAALTNVGHHEQADQELAIAADLDCKNPTIFFNWAVVQSAEGRTEQAVEKYRRVIELDPKNLSAYYNCAALLEKLGRLDGAIEEIRAALEVAPDNDMLKDILARLVQAQRQQVPAVIQPTSDRQQ